MPEHALAPSLASWLDEALATERELAREQLAAAWQLHVEKVTEQLQAGWGAHIQLALEERFAGLRARLLAEAERLVEARVAEAEQRAAVSAAAAARQSVVKALHQAARRLAQADTPTDIYSAVMEAAATFGGRCALFEVGGGYLRGIQARGFPETAAARVEAFEAPLAECPAFANVVESGDLMVTLTTAADLSPAVMHALCLEGEQRATILPLLAGPRVAALMYADGESNAGALTALELILAMAGPALDGVLAVQARRQEQEEPEPAPAAALVTIQPADSPPPQVSAAPQAKDQALTFAEKERHAKAERFARVAVAEMRLYQAAAVLAGRAQRNIYGLLRNEIDMARLSYQEQFLQEGDGLPDYLHRELVRTLANNDAELLGPEYPGPLA